MTQSLDRVGPTVDEILSHAVVDDRESGVVKANRRIFTDEEIFELEMKHIFEGNWVYLAHESQVAEPGDYFTTSIGRQPIVITRDKDGGLHCLINACAHRGAMLCRKKRDNRKTLTCPFHGWTYRNDGTLLKVKDPEGAGYPDSFDTDGSHNLVTVPAFESYRGFLFGSLDPDVVSLQEHLGDTTEIIDMLVDQSPEGLEVLRGSSTYTFDGNWKVQAENGADGYHVTALHWNYAATTSRRESGESKNETKALDAGGWGKSGGGYWSFPHGHLCLWTWKANPEDQPLYSELDSLKEQFGDATGDFMVRGSRNLCLYPNVYLMDQFSTQIRHFRPIAPNQTEAWASGDLPTALTALGIAFSPQALDDPGFAETFAALLPLFPSTLEQVTMTVHQWDADLAHDTADRLGGIGVPTTVLVGEQDLLTPPWQSRKVAEAIPGAEFVLVEGPGSSHGMHTERPDEWLGHVRGHLARHAG